MSTEKKPRLIPWVEKYRPKSLEEIASQEEIVRTLKSSIQSKNLPHLLFYGPAGTGKTSTILAIGRQIYGSLYDDRVLELNASDERGIDVVRNRIKSFAQLSVSDMSRENIPAYKLIILDEADSMTPDAQGALRRTMETYSKSTRFCIICNYVSRIIEPIASRCAKFRFKSLPEEAAIRRLEFICRAEGVPLSDNLCLTATKASNGDLRKAITFIQSAFTINEKNITADSINEVAGVVPSSVIEKLIEACKSNDVSKVLAAVQFSIRLGFPADQILSQLFDFVISSKTFSSTQKSELCLAISEAEKCLLDGADEFLQLMTVFTLAMTEFSKKDDRMEIE